MSDASKVELGGTDDHDLRVHPGTHPSFHRSLGHAWRGARHVFLHERNARIHALFTVLAIAAGVVLHVPAAQMATVFLAIGLVIVAEILNTGIERTLDLIDIHENVHIKLIKDMTAGGVLVASVVAVAVGLMVFGLPLARVLWGS